MTLNDQIAMIERLPPEEQEAFSQICTNQDQDVPEVLLVELLKKRLVIKKRACQGYTVSSHWTHYAWQLWRQGREQHAD